MVAMTPLQHIAALPSINADNGEHGYVVAYGGDSGSGKTRCALSWPEPIRGIYADVNTLTLTTEIEKGRDIDLKVIEKWEQYEALFVPAVENRLLDCKTIVVDTLDFLSNIMWDMLRESVSKKGEGRGVLTIPNFGEGLNKLLKTTERLIRSTRYIKGKPSYNVIFTYHLNDVKDSDGATVKVTPALMGAAKDVIGSCFDTSLLCDSKRIGTPVTKEGRKTTEYRKEFFVHTAAPSREFNSLCKTGPQFPVQCSGMYEDLIGYLKGGK